MIESQINFLVNDLMLKQILFVKDKLQILICMGELIHTRGFLSTKRVAKILHFFQFMIHNLPSDSKEHYKYLMGTLYSIGGMLKLEAKSYLHTRKKEKDSFHNVC